MAVKGSERVEGGFVHLRQQAGPEPPGRYTAAGAAHPTPRQQLRACSARPAAPAAPGAGRRPPGAAAPCGCPAGRRSPGLRHLRGAVMGWRAVISMADPRELDRRSPAQAPAAPASLPARRQPDEPPATAARPGALGRADAAVAGRLRVRRPRHADLSSRNAPAAAQPRT